jgi:prepilin-type N-terminal cleavage/methylation domain-containing protein
MNRCAAPGQGARSRRRGFTLLEMCFVLFIIALLAGLSMPAIESAFVEQGLRNDAHQFALMVRTAMIQSAEQHRAYVMEISSTTMALHPLGEAAKDADDATDNADDDSAPIDAPVVPDVSITQALDPQNKLLIPDPDKSNSWIDMPQVTWTFQPGQLCTATRVRMSRGKAWVEMSFAPLTGSVENEASYIP